MIVPIKCERLLREQRTQLVELSEYETELEKTYNGFKDYLPKDAKNILDIGCGMSWIDVFLSKHYDHKIKIHLADKHGVSPKILSGFATHKDEFSHYHNFDYAIELLTINDVPKENIIQHNLLRKDLPTDEFDIVISLLSWGFHYPISNYRPNLSKNGIIIVDVRYHTTGMKELQKFGTCLPIYESRKYARMLCRPN